MLDFIKRPFYVVGHNTNSSQEVADAVAAGANAVEIDVALDPFTGELCSYDGTPPLPSLAPQMVEFLEWLGQFARIQDTAHQRLALVVFDVKISDPTWGKRLWSLANAALAGTGLKLIYSVASLPMTTLFPSFAAMLGPHEGIMVDQEDDVARVVATLSSLGVVHQCYGDGIFAGGNAPSVHTSIDTAVASKAIAHEPRWVYVWTLATPVTMLDYVRAGVDGIIPNSAEHIAELVQALRGAEFAQFARLGTRADDPFQIPPIAYTITVTTCARGLAGTNSTVTFALEGPVAGAAIDTRIDGSYGARFESGHEDVASIFKADVGMPTRLTLSIDGAGNAPDWLPDSVIVKRSNDPVSYQAYFGDWVIAGRPSSRLLGTTRYALVVYTSDQANAGTDADLVFVVQGTSGTVQRRVNGAPIGWFERGSVNTFEIVGLDVGALTRVGVFNDGSGNAPGWHLDRITVSKNGGASAVFSFQTWIDGEVTAFRP